MALKLAPYQAAAIYSPYTHTGFFGGVGVGKTFTGSQFSCRNFTEWPEATGFIGANTYDQLSQATLKELFYWLEYYQFDYVIDRRPPPEWRAELKYPRYKNILSIRSPKSGKVSHAFIRVLSDPDALRGTEFSWYWIDESRDTPQDTHNVILSRLREGFPVRGLMTSTTNGEDWGYQRFVKGLDDVHRLYGSLHVPTMAAVDLGILTPEYHRSLLQSYSPMLALQELDALHVNVGGGRAYYAAGENNKRIQAPWGASAPSRDYPLIVGCDFNFSPAPCVWMVGQVGPGRYSEHIHWFGEISLNETSTIDMTNALAMRFPGFFYRIFGDASGQRGTTSNAGEVDYMQIAKRLSELGILHAIDVEQYNPLVKNRVENMNAKFKNALGEIRQTYNPHMCPLFDGDVRMVGWKKIISGLTRQGRLDDGGDSLRTHASDGAGYAVWKLFPPGGAMPLVSSLASAIRSEMG
jgi:hypothetical protein